MHDKGISNSCRDNIFMISTVIIFYISVIDVIPIPISNIPGLLIITHRLESSIELNNNNNNN